jgi:hypothetical protein
LVSITRGEASLRTPIPTPILRKTNLVNSTRELLSAWCCQNSSELLGENPMFDKDTQQLVGFFQKKFQLSKYFERDPVKYVKRHESEIKTTGQMLKYLNLAKSDKRSPLGWRPTHPLMDIINKKAARKSMPIGKSTSTLEHLFVYLLDDTVFGADNDEPGTLCYVVLQELGLVREDDLGDLVTTDRLVRLFEDAYFKHLYRRSLRKGK